MADIGYLSIVTGLIVAVYSVICHIIGIRTGNKRMLDSGKGGVAALVLLLTVASASLIYLLMTSDFSIKYVANYTSRDLVSFYKFAAFWAGQEGSLLLWVWFLSIYTILVTFWKYREGREMVPYVTGILMGIAVFFLFLLSFVTNPFARLPVVPPDGSGLNPLLQNPGMVAHPITLYLGYVGFSVPYAFAIAALLMKNPGDIWIRITRKWTLISWLWLSLGIIYGAQWAYVELGWGGYWAWDPVENASLLPWLVGTAFFHSVMIQEKRGMLKIWNVMLIIGTFLLTLFGTFLTRSGYLGSVHAFGESVLGVYFIGFIGLVFAISLYIVLESLTILRQQNKFESIVSKEASFLLNNLLFVGIAFAVFWGTVFPIISKLARGIQVSVGPPFFNQVMVPLGILLIILTGICPLIAWRKSTPEKLRDNFLYSLIIGLASAVLMFVLGIRKPFALLSLASTAFVASTIVSEVYRGVKVRRKMGNEGAATAFLRLINKNRRRYGGYLVHLGILMMVVGITASSAYSQQITKTVTTGEMITLGGYSLEFSGLEEKFLPDRAVVFADMKVYKEGRFLGTIRPSKDFYPKVEEPSTEVAIKGGLLEDFYVILGGWSNSGKEVTFKVLINPMVAWIWIGTYVLVAGTVFAVWPRRADLAYGATRTASQTGAGLPGSGTGSV